MPPRSEPAVRRFPQGAEPGPKGCAFRVWAPAHDEVSLVLADGAEHPMDAQEDGYFSLTLPVGPGCRYRYRLGDGAELFADPASRFQPEGLDGPSEVIDPAAFAWSDGGWTGSDLAGAVLYELHVGTFTPEGSWAAATDRLERLRRLGVGIIELMPVGAFEGAFGWGYDGALPYAPSHLYGRPDAMRHFIDAAHGLGIGVILDVVYNHFGFGSRHAAFASAYFREEETEWGRLLNLDARTARPARDYAVANALGWIEDFHLDGLRIDATQAIKDESDEHVLAEIVRRGRAAASHRRLLFVAENEPEDSRLVRPPEAGGYGLDAVWNEDFNRTATVAATGRREGYFHDHAGSAAELVAGARHGFLFQGQRQDWQARPRGRPSRDIPPRRLVNYLQNHDQVANAPGGRRFWQRTGPGRARALTALFLLLPQTPMLFQGQEFAASTPFHYFLGTGGTLGEKAQRGRIDFLRQFATRNDEQAIAALPDPSHRTTFERSRLDWAEAERNGDVLALHRDLITLRKATPAIARQPCVQEGLFDAGVIGRDALLLRWFDGEADGHRLLLVNLGPDLMARSIPDPLAAPPEGREWRLIWSSEAISYGGEGRRPLDLAEPITLAADSAHLFAPVPRRKRHRPDGAEIRERQHRMARGEGPDDARTD